MSRNDELLDRPLARGNVPNVTETLAGPLARLRSEVDRLFEGFPGTWPAVRFTLSSGMLVPAVEMTEKKKAYNLSVEVPGMDATDIDMHVHDGTIYISGEKKERRDEDEKGYSYSERSYGAFERRVELPPGADAKSIKAKVRNGILEITIPKKPDAAAKRQRIEVESA
jgi:HSP20 family protein